jgi:hypothetical protein
MQTMERLVLAPKRATILPEYYGETMNRKPDRLPPLCRLSLDQRAALAGYAACSTSPGESSGSSARPRGQSVAFRNNPQPANLHPHPTPPLRPDRATGPLTRGLPGRSASERKVAQISAKSRTKYFFSRWSVFRGCYELRRNVHAWSDLRPKIGCLRKGAHS